MGIPSIKNRVGMTVTGTPGTGTITLNAAESGYQSFATAYGANANVDILIEDGTAWEIARDCTYTHSGTTVTRGTLEASSTGSAISLTSAAKVYVVHSAGRKYPNDLYGRGYIDGGVIAYLSATAITISACRVNINGVIRQTNSTTTLTSATTMKDMANSTVTLGASKCYFVFAYNNAGTLEFRCEDRDTTGDGADPTWDADLDYWKAATTGAEARRIGKFWTDSSNNIIKFWYTERGRVRTLSVENVAGLLVLNAGTSTSYASLTVTPYITADDISMLLGLQISQSAAAVATTVMQMSIDSGTTYAASIGGIGSSTTVSQVRLRPVTIPSRGTLHYLVSGTNAAGSVILLGSEFIA